jgi:hypothetical protein
MDSFLRALGKGGLDCRHRHKRTGERIHRTVRLQGLSNVQAAAAILIARLFVRRDSDTIETVRVW